MSISIRKKYIKSNNEKNKILQQKEYNIQNDKNYNYNTYINPKLRNKDKYLNNSREKIYNKKETKRNYIFINIFNNDNKANNNIQNNNSIKNYKYRRNLSQDFISKNISKININHTISILLTHEIEKIKINLLKYLINDNDMNTVFNNIYEIIEDLIDEYNLNNNCYIDKEENRRLIEVKYQILKNNVMNEYRLINKEIYTKYFTNKKQPNDLFNKLLPLTNFKKHCIKCKDIAIHKSKNPLYLIPNTNYIICKQTNEIYNKNYFECYCEYDGEIYISSYIYDNFRPKLMPLTYIGNLEDEMCKCLECGHILYYNSRNKNIKCIKCNNDDIEENIVIFYIDTFFKKLKEEINFALILKRKSMPNKYCICGGIYFQTKFLDKFILVCSQCKKCEYDKRNGLNKYRFYLFKNKRNDNNNYNRMKLSHITNKEKENNEKKIITNYYNFRNKNRNKTSNYNVNVEYKYKRFENIENEKNKVPKLFKEVKSLQIKVIQDDKFKNKKTNYNRFIRNNNNRCNTNYQYLNEGEENNKKNNYYETNKNSLREILKNKKDIVKNRAKLLLSNKKNNKNSFIATTLVVSRKERALRRNYLEKNDNSLEQINKIKINKLFTNSLGQISFKILMENINSELMDDIKDELKSTLTFKKNLTNNNSIEKLNIKSENTRIIHLNHHQSLNNIYTNVKSIYEKINQEKFVIPSNLNINDYKILNLINSGSFSNIYQVQNIKTKKKFVVKKIIVEGNLKLEKFKNDIQLMQSLNKGYFFEDVNIVPIIQYYIKKLDLTAYAIYELMPLAQSDWNKQIFREKTNYNETELIKILKQISNALYYMQKNNICHRDIKPSNIFIINDNYYIGDFSESIKIDENPNMITEIKGTEAFLSPIMFEALVKNQKKVKHNLYKSDMYSFGLCFVFAITRNLYVLQLIKETKIGENIKKLILENQIDKKNKYTHSFIDLLTKILCWDEENRIDFIELNNILNEMNI